MGFLCCASRSNPAYSSDATPSTAPQTVRPTPTVTPARDQSLHLSKKKAGSAKAPSVKKVPSAKKLLTVPPPTPSSATSGSAIQPQPYIATRATDLFSSYADPDDPTVIGPEGFERLCSDVGLQMDGAQPLVLAWMLEAAEMGKITKDEWSKATGSLQISALPQLALAVKDLVNLLLLHKEPPKRPKSGSEPYNRAQYWGYAEPPASRKKAFLKLYMHCFALAKPPQARNIDMETASALWSVVLAPEYPIMMEVIEFINEKGTYKGANKDLWSMMIEFCQTVHPNLDNYETDGAWPTLLDDFVSWKTAKLGVGNGSGVVGV